VGRGEERRRNPCGSQKRLGAFHAFERKAAAIMADRGMRIEKILQSPPIPEATYRCKRRSILRACLSRASIARALAKL
jgi:hypothetical protein